METTWSLDELYTSFDSPEFQNDFAELKKVIEHVKKWAAENFASQDNAREKIEGYIGLLLDMEKFGLLSSFASLSISADSENEQAAKYSDMLQVAHSEMSVPDAAFRKFVAGREDLDEIINSSPLLTEHSFYLSEIKRNGKYRLSEKEEAIISKMEGTGSGSWAKMKEKLASSLMVEVSIDGEVKKLPLAMARNLSRSESGDVRKNAYEAELESYKLIETPVAAALNSIKGEAIAIAKMRGYESVLDMTIKSSRMEKNVLDAMLDAIREYLPVFTKYYRHKAKLLGHTGGLPFYDVAAPVGNVTLKFSYEEAADYVVKNFSEFSEKMGKFARNAFDNRWIDVYPRKGKRGGAFCSGLHYLKQSRILTNFSESFASMLTLAHELGHGYHGLCLSESSHLNCRYPMPLAETASTFCETLVTKAALKTASKDEAFAILESDIYGSSQVIVDIYSRFLFEDEVFKRRENGPLTVKEFCGIMEDSQKKAYGDGLDHNFLHPYMWINKTHYYYARRNYYNWPYAYGQLFALGLYAKYTEDPSAFIQNYDALLVATGKSDLLGVGKLMDIDVSDKAFWVSSLKVIEKDINKFIELS